MAKTHVPVTRAVFMVPGGGAMINGPSGPFTSAVGPTEHMPVQIRKLLDRPTIRFPLVALRIANGWSSHGREERDCLTRWAAGRSCLVELGVAEGTGTSSIRRAMPPDATLYAVDPFPPGRLGFSVAKRIARLQVARVRGGDVRWLETTALAAAAILRDASLEPDFVFSDCVFFRAELEPLWTAWRDLVGEGGVFVQSTSRVMPGRTSPEHETVRFTADVLLADTEFECVDTAGTFTVLRRRRRL